MKYSLANYICNIKPNDPTLLAMFGTINVGGEGSTTESLSAGRSNALYDTASFATGGYVHNKNLSKVGTISVTLNQLSNNVAKLKRLINAYQSNDYQPLTISLTDSDGNIICSGIDCLPTQIPNQDFRDSAQSQTWTFTCGELNFE